MVINYSSVVIMSNTFYFLAFLSIPGSLVHGPKTHKYAQSANHINIRPNVNKVDTVEQTVRCFSL